MKSFIITSMFVLVAGSLATPAWAMTKLDTTRASVDKECGLTHGGAQKSGCVRDCGSTSCHYHCEGSKCTVTIYRAVPTPTKPTRPVTR